MIITVKKEICFKTNIGLSFKTYPYENITDCLANCEDLQSIQAIEVYEIIRGNQCFPISAENILRDADSIIFEHYSGTLYEDEVRIYTDIPDKVKRKLQKMLDNLAKNFGDEGTWKLGRKIKKSIKLTKADIDEFNETRQVSQNINSQIESLYKFL